MQVSKFHRNYWHELWLVIVTVVVSGILLKFGCPHCSPKNWALFGVVNWFVLLVLCEIFTPRCSWRYEGAYIYSWIISIVLSCIACFIWMKKAGVACTTSQTFVIIGGYIFVCIIGILLQKLAYRLFDDDEKVKSDKKEYIRKYGKEAFDCIKK